MPQRYGIYPWQPYVNLYITLTEHSLAIIHYSIDIIYGNTSISALHSMSTEAMSILESGGSRGNSIICLPREVRPPVSSRAPRTHSWNMELRMLSWKGGGGGGGVRRERRKRERVCEKKQGDTVGM